MNQYFFSLPLPLPPSAFFCCSIFKNHSSKTQTHLQHSQHKQRCFLFITYCIPCLWGAGTSNTAEGSSCCPEVAVGKLLLFDSLPPPISECLVYLPRSLRPAHTLQYCTLVLCTMWTKNVQLHKQLWDKIPKFPHPLGDLVGRWGVVPSCPDGQILKVFWGQG